MPWWINWMYGLLGVSILMTASSMDLAWNHWRENYATDDGSDEEERYELRSTYSRFSAASLLFVTGCTTAAFALLLRSQFVIAMGILPKTLTTERSVFVQTYRTGERQGFRIPIQESKLIPGKKPDQLILNVEGRIYSWALPLDADARIHGEKLDVKEARRRIIADWGSKYISKELTGQTGGIAIGSRSRGTGIGSTAR
ncbi:hypothetical protein BDZ89DRAFT_1066283 [Hymenopellis radicata]|nr:hypothetical protein BDZ89DRAFT_1066283 [Hymenopellis radicata]